MSFKRTLAKHTMCEFTSCQTSKRHHPLPCKQKQQNKMCFGSVKQRKPLWMLKSTFSTFDDLTY